MLISEYIETPWLLTCNSLYLQVPKYAKPHPSTPVGQQPPSVATTANGAGAAGTTGFSPMGQAVTAAQEATNYLDHNNTNVLFVSNQPNAPISKFKKVQLHKAKNHLRFRSGIRFSTMTNNYESTRKMNKSTDDTIELNKYTMNLSTKQLTETQSKVLSKVLKFVPSTK